MSPADTTVEMPWGVGPETTLREVPVPPLPACEDPAGPGAPASHGRPPETPPGASWWPALVGVSAGLLLGVVLLVTAWQLFLWSVFN